MFLTESSEEKFLAAQFVFFIRGVLDCVSSSAGESVLIESAVSWGIFVQFFLFFRVFLFKFRNCRVFRSKRDLRSYLWSADSKSNFHPPSVHTILFPILFTS